MGLGSEAGLGVFKEVLVVSVSFFFVLFFSVGCWWWCLGSCVCVHTCHRWAPGPDRLCSARRPMSRPGLLRRGLRSRFRRRAAGLCWGGRRCGMGPCGRGGREWRGTGAGSGCHPGLAMVV